MFSFGGFPHFLFVMLAGLLWLVVIAVIAGILFLVVRFAVLSALKAHSRWHDAGKPEVSAWNQRPAPHPGFETQPQAHQPQAHEPQAHVPPAPEPAVTPSEPTAPAEDEGSPRPPRAPRRPKKP